MKILRIAQKLYPDVNGGGAYHAHALSRDQAELGHDVTTLTVRTDEDLPEVETRDGYTIVRYDPAASVLGNDVSLELARDLVNYQGFDVIHAHSHLYFSTNLAALRRLLGTTPLAITNHGLHSQTVPGRVSNVYLRTVGRYTFDAADLVFTYTETERRRLRELGVTSDIAVVSNGIDTDRFRPEGPESGSIGSDGPAVLFVGRFVEGKRPATAITAFESVRETHPDAELYLCGDGPLRGELEARVRDAGVDDAVTFLGHVPYPGMPEVYRSASVLVLPSRAEGMPRSVLEAMATGTPVVTTNLPHLETALPNAGEVVQIGPDESFADAMIDIITNSSDRSLAARRRTVATREFTWEETVRSTTAELRALVGSEDAPSDHERHSHEIQQVTE